MPDIRVERTVGLLTIYDKFGGCGYVEIPEEHEEYVLERLKKEVNNG